MNTFAFINNLKNNIKKVMNNNNTTNNKIEHTPILEQTPNSPSAATAMSLPVSKTTHDVSPAVVNMIKSKYNELENNGNDLGAYAMETCVGHNGSVQGFVNMLNVILGNYKVEAERLEQDVKTELSTDINKLNYKIIELKNKIHSIESFSIPEKQEELHNQELQVDSLMNNQEYSLSASLSSERLLIIQLAAARTKEIIRDLKKTTVQLQTEIDQIIIGISGLELQLQQINFYNESVLKRRLGLFLNHWLIALNGIGANELLYKETQTAFSIYQTQQLELITAA